jgi:hypothetical protein
MTGLETVCWNRVDTLEIYYIVSLWMERENIEERRQEREKKKKQVLLEDLFGDEGTYLKALQCNPFVITLLGLTLSSTNKHKYISHPPPPPSSSD